MSVWLPYRAIALVVTVGQLSLLSDQILNYVELNMNEIALNSVNSEQCLEHNHYWTVNSHTQSH